MRIASIRVENFRSLREFEMEPKDGTNLLVGENNSGKSALLVALERALGRATPEFDLEDFYVTTSSTNPASLPTIVIDVQIRPAVGGRLSTNFSTEFVNEITLDAAGEPALTFRTQAHYDQTEERIVTEFSSVRTDGSSRQMTSAKRFVLRGYIPFYLVDAFRDTVRDLQNRRGILGTHCQFDYSRPYHGGVNTKQRPNH